MKTIKRIHKQTSVRALVLATVLMLAALAPTPAQAATTYTVSDDASCTAFLTAIGATGDSLGSCFFYTGTLAATDTLTIAGTYRLRPQGPLVGTNTANFTNNGIVNINSNGGCCGGLYGAGTIDNQGSININAPDSQNYDTINNHGTITLTAAFYNHDTINNFGTIVCLAGGSVQGEGTITGNRIPSSCDGTLPIITASGTKADNTPYTAGTWTNQTVTVHFTCSDTGSGIATCPVDVVLIDKSDRHC